MTPDDHDPLVQRLGQLSVIDPDSACSDRVRTRCHAALSQRRLSHGSAVGERMSPPRLFERGLAYGLPVVYLLALIVDLLRVYDRP